MTMTAAQVAQERERRAKKQGGGGKYSYVKIEPNTTVYLRIGPPWKKDGEVWKDCYFHGNYPNKVYCANNDTDEETGKARRCVVERRQKKLKGVKTKSSKKLWSLLNQKSEGLWNCLVVSKYKKLANGKIIVRRYEDNKFKLLRLSGKWHNLLLDIFSDEDLRTKSLLGVTHSKYGRLIKVKRIGKGMEDTSYSFTAVMRASPIFKSLSKRKKILETLIDLDEVVTGSSDEELEAFVHRAEKKAKKLARQDEEEDDRDDEDDEETEDSDDKDDSDSDDDDEDSEESEDEDSDEDDMEKQYRKMKKNIKSKKSKKEDDEDEEEDE